MHIQEIGYQTIEQVWRDKLWPGRVSKIEPYSAMMFMHDKYDISFSELPQIFLGGYVDGILIAVNSMHLAEKYMARSRGLWVDPAFRGNGYGIDILRKTNDAAKKLNADAIWSFPRKSSIVTYITAGYTQASSWMDHGEFGPNCYVISKLK
jgi:GNAT superfamily N-acetyltransferase